MFSSITFTFDIVLTSEQEKQLNDIEAMGDIEYDKNRSLLGNERKVADDLTTDKITAMQRLVLYPVFKALKFSDLTDWEW